MPSITAYGRVRLCPESMHGDSRLHLERERERYGERREREKETERDRKREGGGRISTLNEQNVQGEKEREGKNHRIPRDGKHPSEYPSFHFPHWRIPGRRGASTYLSISNPKPPKPPDRIPNTIQPALATVTRDEYLCQASAVQRQQPTTTMMIQYIRVQDGEKYVRETEFSDTQKRRAEDNRWVQLPSVELFRPWR